MLRELYKSGGDEVCSVAVIFGLKTGSVVSPEYNVSPWFVGMHLQEESTLTYFLLSDYLNGLKAGSLN